MKLFYLVNSDSIGEDKTDKNTIVKIFEKAFNEKVEEYKVYNLKNMRYGDKVLDYNFVVDGMIEDNVRERKRIATDEIKKYFEELYGRQLLSLVRIETNFNIDSITGGKKNTSSDNSSSLNSDIQEFDYQRLSKNYKPVDPAYTFDRVILPQKVKDRIEESLAIVLCERKVFDEWGLSVIQPNPSSALNFYGPSGTGKTMAAEAIANKLNKKILKASYADIESKFHGEGPKMVKAIFMAAQNEDAVLFIDESESLLSKRLTNVTQGSEQAINSMRSQLLICLEEYKGIVIFATNLFVNYDQAFRTRLINVEFVKPDLECRKKIWDVHISGNGIKIPLASDVDTQDLAEKYDFCGRDIRKSVITACVSVAMKNGDTVTHSDFLSACEKVKEEEEGFKKAEDYSSSKRIPTEEQQDLIKSAIKNKIDADKSS
ncbi:MAG: ATP-binding protein [Oscillospiraceae bacterium]|nr:ATP-binding protein [Oscillospiraceae bacterium]